MALLDAPAAPGRPRRGGWPISITCVEAMNAARLALGYSLTAAQQRVLSDILSDLAGPQTMMRLLQGDVGCGKTAVALLAMMAACGSGADGSSAIHLLACLLARFHGTSGQTIGTSMPGPPHHLR